MKSTNTGPTKQPVRAALAAYVGTTIEWYDFYIYSTAAALVFGRVFFSSQSHFIGEIAALATFAVGFLTRPLGAVLFGHIGDRISRKQSLVITLTVMGCSTALVGLLPSYDTLGIFAPLLLILLRIVQGIAVGGEWGGAVLVAAEHAPARWRILLGSAPQYGSPTGLILATTALGWASSHPEAEFLDWAWRVPFLLAAPLVLIAFLIRNSLVESPALAEDTSMEAEEPKAPLIEILRGHKALVLLGLGTCMLGVAGFYFNSTLMVAITTQYLGKNESDILHIMSTGGMIEIVSYLCGSFIAMRIGEKGLLMLASGLAILWAAPLTMLVMSGSLAHIAIALWTSTFLVGMYYSVLAPYLPTIFPPHLRYTGISLALQASGALFGGTTPLIGLWLVEHFGLHWAPLALLFVLIAGASFVSVVLLKARAGSRAQPLG